jgi:PIN domain nuclease of toxin-antitoxin system
VALETRGISLPHQDPADRFLAATAAVYDLTLLTADDRLLDGSGYSVVGNE